MDLLKPWEVYKDTVKNIPAYSDFLKSLNYDFRSVEDTEGFQSLPIMTKENYFKKFALETFFKNGKFPELGYASSGSSGEGSFWFRGEELDPVGMFTHNLILKENFQIKPSEPTLVLVCFSMGVWVAGMYTSDSFRKLSKSWNITVMTPSMDRVSIKSIVARLGKNFKNIILCGYPPFLMNLLFDLSQLSVFENINWFLVSAGDKHSEAWRDEALEITKNTNISSVTSVYGSSDAGPIAFETPLSILIRRICQSKPRFREEIMGGLALDPAVFQYDPRFMYLETVKDELLITADISSPLVRYNIRDRVRIFDIGEIMKKLNDYGVRFLELPELFMRFNYPLLVMGGRNDVGITYWAMNLFADQLSAWRRDWYLFKMTTGNFSIYKLDSGFGKSEELYFKIQLVRDVSESRESIKLIFRDKIHSSLLTVSPEYKKLCESEGESAFIKIELVENNNPVDILKGLKGLLFEDSKKTKVIY